MKKVLMAKGAHTVVNICIQAQPEEKILIITEASKMCIAESIAAAVVAARAEPVIAVIVPRENDGQEPPQNIAAAMKESDAFICVVGKSITHTHAVKNAKEAGSRGVVLTQFSEDMMIHGGLECDFRQIAPECQEFAKVLAGAKQIHLTTPQGTDLTFTAEGRRGNALYCMVEPGQFSTVPTIEANVSPCENSAQGKIVADASVPYIGIGVLEEPIYCDVKDGFITAIKGGRQAKMLLQDLNSKEDPNCFNVAEMGIGLNPHCHFCGFMLEDEGVRGAVHIGIGTSITLGGTVKAKTHYDLIMTGATIEVDGRVILKNGVPCIFNQ